MLNLWIYTINQSNTVKKKNNRENKTARFTSSRHRRAKTRRPGGLTHGLGKKKTKTIRAPTQDFG